MDSASGAWCSICCRGREPPALQPRRLMGMYDTLHVGERTEQVKLWGRTLSWFHLGDHVGPPRLGLAPHGSYSVAMVTGGYVHVHDGRIAAWEPRPGPQPVVDTRGEAVPDVPDGVVPIGTPEHRRTAALMADSDQVCPSCSRPPLRAVGVEERDAEAAARTRVAAFLAAHPSDDQRVAAARDGLRDGAYSRTAVQAARALLAVEQDARLLLQLLDGTERGARELKGAAFLVELSAGDLPADDLVRVLRLLVGFVPTAEEEAAAEADPALPEGDPQSHPRLRLRQALVALDDPQDREQQDRSFLAWLERLGDLEVQAAARAAVAAHGAPALAGVLCRYWSAEVAATRLIVQVLEERLDRPLTADERAEVRWAFDGSPGYLDELSDEQVEGLLADAVRRRRR